jgi:hypothetical protein
MKVRFVVILANSIIPYLYAAYFLYRKDQHALAKINNFIFNIDIYDTKNPWNRDYLWLNTKPYRKTNIYGSIQNPTEKPTVS